MSVKVRHCSCLKLRRYGHLAAGVTRRKHRFVVFMKFWWTGPPIAAYNAHDITITTQQ